MLSGSRLPPGVALALAWNPDRGAARALPRACCALQPLLAEREAEAPTVQAERQELGDNHQAEGP